MRFDRIRLSNFKCYGDADLRLNAGVTVIYGLNGSGKSSLLEACFFALYGSRALDTTLDEVVTIGADDAEVELWFTHAGSEYRVERRIRATGENAAHARCVLKTPDSTIEGARDVRRHVEDLLRMDADAFVNCAYVRQGEVNKLINASPGQRQDMLDSLLQLGKLEDYRERASDARVGVGRVLDDKRGRLSGLEDQIAEKEEKDLHARLNALEDDLADVVAEIEDKEAQREKAVETRDGAQSVLDEYEEKREELEAVETEIEEKRDQITETEREREELADRLSDLRSELSERRESLTETLAETDLDEDPDGVEPSTVRQRLADLEERDEELQEAIKDASVEKQKHEERASTLRSQVEDLEEEAAEARSEADQLESEVEGTRETVAQRREKVETLAERIADLEAEFETVTEAFPDASVAFGEADGLQERVATDLEEARESVAQLEAAVQNQQEAIAEAEALLEAGKCPECGQDVEGAPHVDTVEEDRERLSELESDLGEARDRRDELAERKERADRMVEIETEVAQTRTNRENVEQLVDEKESALAEKAEQVADLREDAAEAESEAAEKREAAAEHDEDADACRERIGDLNGERGDLRERRERLETVRDGLDALADLEDEVAQCREKRDRLESFNDERRETLADLREERNDLEDEFDESRLEEARTERDRAERYLEQVEPHLDELEERRDELQGNIGAVEQEITELESLREQREGLAERVAWLESLYDEAERLQAMYGDLRADLRQRNVESLEAMLNEIFELIYQNDSYARIELTGEYELTVYQKDGEPLDPEQLSGGERALFNLSLRCAIYRLLAEGIEGAAPMPPLILDEPTVFLDSGHVSQLVELVETMRSYGVEQILVVSHDEELVSAAEDLVRVRKDTQTNRSTVSREAPSEQILEAD